ncbi:MerR family transcriptional regulator [Candidatus Soleaferrea massiliensis]|uniref:MerR family transcriptional regulator n=1 Tax=Candidatus Soleaferrea massiliensis TaxID=1470354 RepID=UPI00058F3922|nr:MerR family transcriptional regulator [Candidatus Soleaferrea massiliensis]
MEKTVREVSRLSGVSVRTLHYYDEIGLLHPSRVTDAGYRLYDEKALSRLQQILFFKELGFPLKEIRQILDDPSFDEYKALESHRRLLQMQHERLDNLIRLVDHTLKGENHMEFKPFDKTEILKAQELYAKEAKERWGDTDAYRQSTAKTSGYTDTQWEQISEEFEKIYQAFAECMELEPSDSKVQQLVAGWQTFITDHFYTCTNEILAGLGEMYVADERFRANIDRYGDGLASFISRAIAHYCKD